MAQATNRGTLDKNEVVRLVRQSLRSHQTRGVSVDVLEDAIRPENGWWKVPVRPQTDYPTTYAYYEYLAEVESDLQEKAQLNILLVPTSPD